MPLKGVKPFNRDDKVEYYDAISDEWLPATVLYRKVVLVPSQRTPGVKVYANQYTVRIDGTLNDFKTLRFGLRPRN